MSDKEKELLEKRSEIAVGRLAEIERLIDKIKADEDEAEACFRAIENGENSITFDELLWQSLIDFLTVNEKNSVTVTFKGGTTVTVKT